MTKDENGSWELANGIAQRLRREGFGGDGKVFPLRVWVEDEHGNEVKTKPEVVAIRNEDAVILARHLRRLTR